MKIYVLIACESYNDPMIQPTIRNVKGFTDISTADEYVHAITREAKGLVDVDDQVNRFRDSWDSGFSPYRNTVYGIETLELVERMKE